MVLFGATTLAQYESYDKDTGAYEIASLVGWSPTLHKEARNILLSDGTSEPYESNTTLDQWLKKQDLSSMVGTRRYKDEDGITNFMGISAMEYNPADRGAYAMTRREVELWAKQAAILSIKSQVESYKAAERTKRAYKGADGILESTMLQSMAEEMSESVKDLTIRGLEIIRTKKVVHGPSGRDIVVAVANVNSAMAVKSPGFMEDIYATLKEVNADQSFIKGQEDGMKTEAAKTLNNPSIYNDGSSAGAQSVASEYDDRTSVSGEENKEKQQQASEEPTVEQNTVTKPAGQSRSGVWSGDMDVDDDF